MRRAAAVFALLALAFAPASRAQGHGHDALDPAAREQPTVRANVPIEKLRALYTTKELEAGTYVGDEFCISCHTWSGITRAVKHRQALRIPMGVNSLVPGRGVVADYDQNGVDDFIQGLDFNAISSVFDAYKPNAPILGYNAEADTYWITIGPLTVQVWITQGGTGEWKQRYLVRIPTGSGGWTKDLYISPIQYNEATHAYVSYHPEAWWDPATKAPRFGAAPTRAAVAAVGRSYSKACIGCHTTGIRSLFQDSAGEYNYRPYPAALVNPAYVEQYPDYDQDSIPDIVNVGCEACHGPGSRHILGGGDPDMILAPSELDTDKANEICEQCHVRVKSVPTVKFDWPRNELAAQNEKSWIPGVTTAPLKDYYTRADGLWPDGKHAKQHHQQYHEFYESSKPGFPFHPVRCTECHSPHRGGENMVRTSINDDGLIIPTRNDNNTLCLACHATHGPFADITKEQVAEYETHLDHIAKTVSAHTYHPYAPERLMGLSRCSTCHMAPTATTAVAYDIHTHTFEPVAPEKTLAYQEAGGMPNACAVSCHAQKVTILGTGYDLNLSLWNEATDVKLAEKLLEWYGPGGQWWDTHEEESLGGKAVRTAPSAKIYVPPDLDEE